MAFSVLQMEDEDSILPRKLQAALEHILEQRNELASDKEEGSVNGKQGKARRCSGQTTSLPALFVHSCHFSEESYVRAEFSSTEIRGRSGCCLKLY